MADRRTEIVEAALDLLAERPLARVTTRAIARRVGFSQPAVFRHFPSRQALLQGMLARVREEMAARVGEVLEGREGLAAARALAGELAARVEARPGVLALLFETLATHDRVLASGVAALVDSWCTLVGAAVEEARACAEVPPGVDPRAAGALLVAALQGTFLQWRLAGRPPGLSGRVAQVLSAWEAALVAGHPAGGCRPAAVEGAAAPGPRPAPGGPELDLLDVRPVLAGRRDPLGDILARLEALAPDGLLLVVAPFRPDPLLVLLGRRGLAVEAEPVDGGWRVLVRPPGAPEPLDLRGRPAPEPFEVALARSEALAPGELVLLRTPQVPHPLLAELERRGLVARALEDPAGGALVAVRRPAAVPAAPGAG